MELGDGNKKRDEVLRRRLLETLHLARGYSPTGGLSGVRLKAVTAESTVRDMSFEDDRHFLRLCTDLMNHGLTTRSFLERRKSQSFGVDHVAYAITAKGTQLIEEHIPPIAGIDDDRIVEGD